MFHVQLVLLMPDKKHMWEIQKRRLLFLINESSILWCSTRYMWIVLLIQWNILLYYTIYTRKKVNAASSITFFCETYAHTDKWSEREIPFDLLSQRKRNKFMDILKLYTYKKNTVCCKDCSDRYHIWQKSTCMNCNYILAILFFTKKIKVQMQG